MPPQELNTSPLPVLPPPHKSSKHFLWFLVVFIALGIAGWVYYTIQKTEMESSVPDSMVTPEVKSDWKTYRNDQYGFELQYPNDWTAQNDLLGPTNLSGPGEDGTKVKDEFLLNSIAWDVRDLVPGKDLDTYAQEKIMCEDGGCETLKIENVSIAGVPGKRLYAEGKYPFYRYVFIHNNKVYSLEDKLNSEGESKELSHIISTFKFNGSTNYDSHNDTTLAGQDNDHNGIRDDMDLFILNNYSDSERFQKAAQQYVSNLQKIIVNYNDIQLEKSLIKGDLDATICLVDIFGDQGTTIRSLLRAEMLNTKIRSHAYLSTGQTTYSSRISDANNEINSPSEPKKYSTCNFDPDKLSK